MLSRFQEIHKIQNPKGIHKGTLILCSSSPSYQVSSYSNICNLSTKHLHVVFALNIFLWLLPFPAEVSIMILGEWQNH